MNVSGPLPVPQAPPVEDTSVALRMSQRISAEVLQVAGERVLLSLDGVRLVARLTTPDQAALLEARKMAQFVVKDASGELVQLQLLKPGEAAQQWTAQELLPSVLNGMGVPVNQINQEIARALIAQGRALSPEITTQLAAALVASGHTSPEAAQAAVTLFVAGLPISPQSLELVMKQLPPPAGQLARLISRLRPYMNSNLPAGVERWLQTALTALEGYTQPSPAPSAEMLRTAARALAQPPEQSLLKSQGEPAALRQAEQDNPQLALLRLKGWLVERGDQNTATQVERFLERLRVQHFLNSQPDDQPGQEHWLRLELPVTPPALPQAQQPSPQTARVRIAVEGDGEQRHIDPAYTRLVVEIEAAPGEMLSVDLSVVGHMAAAQVSASSAQMRECARAEINGLESGLAEVGYHLQSSRCLLDEKLVPPDQSAGKADNRTLYEIDREA